LQIETESDAFAVTARVYDDPRPPRVAARPDAGFGGAGGGRGRRDRHRRAGAVVLEAMKMEHTVATPLDGVLTALHVGPGDQVESGQPLAVVEVPE
jgi:Biotin-requiring enzyme